MVILLVMWVLRGVAAAALLHGIYRLVLTFKSDDYMPKKQPILEIVISALFLFLLIFVL